MHNLDFLQIYPLQKFLLNYPISHHLRCLKILVIVFHSLFCHSNSSHNVPILRLFQHRHLCPGTALHLHRANMDHQLLLSDPPPLQWIVYKHLFLATVLHLLRQLCLPRTNPCIPLHSTNPCIPLPHTNPCLPMSNINLCLPLPNTSRYHLLSRQSIQLHLI